MSKHRPIKFETTLEPSLKKLLVQNLQENQNVKSTLNATLGLIALGGFLTVGVFAPNAVGIFGKILGIDERDRKKRYRALWQSYHRLKNQHALQFKEEINGVAIYGPSPFGMKKIKKLVYDELTLVVPKRWDEKWRLVIFDIPEKFRKKRNGLRTKLKELDFYQCQKSAWMHPFPCLEEISFVVEMLGLSRWVKLFTIDEMTDGKVLYHFKELLKTVI